MNPLFNTKISKNRMSKDSKQTLGNGPSSNTRSKVPNLEVDFNKLDDVLSKKVEEPVVSDDEQTIKKTGKKIKLSLEELITKGIANMLSHVVDLSAVDSEDEEDDEDDDDDESTDEDEISISSAETWEECYNDEERDYLKSLSVEERDELILEENAIRVSRKAEVPLRFKIIKSNLSDGAKFLVMSKLDQAEICASEESSGKLYQWVNGLAMIPFGKYIGVPVKMEDGIPAVRKFLFNTSRDLQKSIFGHNEPKAQIMEYITQYITNPNSHGKCLAIQGPPGNGKTTLVRNGIAKAMGRPFAHISLGGMSEGSFLCGHDYTYEGSQCGRIVNILKETGVMNPVIYFDELDKVSASHRGEEIYNFLCHLTDFSQNTCFHDKYYDGIDFDLSKAIFIFSFNDVSRINPILLDRLHIIHTKGFGTEEKTTIASDFLLPELTKEIGLSTEDIIFPYENLKYIASEFCKDEQGVRKFKRIIESILTKINILRFTKCEDETEEKIKLPYDIPNMQFPLTISCEILDKLLKDLTREDQSFLRMYN
jgi:ATP-dependent Lon protease